MRTREKVGCKHWLALMREVHGANELFRTGRVARNDSTVVIRIRLWLSSRRNLFSREMNSMIIGVHGITKKVARLDDWGLGAGLEGVCQPALAAVLAIFVDSHLLELRMSKKPNPYDETTHENTSSTFSSGALATKSLNLAIRVYLIVF
jgi:hypothetical protein